MKFVLKFLILSILVSFFNYYSFTYSSYSEELNVLSETSVLIEYDTGEILFESNSNKIMYPASTTKIMTAILTLENLKLTDSITVPIDMGSAEGSAMFLLPGETFTVKELLEALLIKSANDAAVLLAKEISGDIDKFAILMNERAKNIGCLNTHFTNPNGLHDPNHTSTAYDMALIAREAMKNKTFKSIVSKESITLDATVQTPEKRYYLNTNKFLWSNSKIIYNNEYIPIKYDVVDGIKTGTTTEAGNCLITSGNKNGLRLICVVLKSHGYEVYRDSRILLDYGFDNYIKKTLVKSNDIIGTYPVKFSIQKELTYATKEDFIVPYLKSKPPIFNTKVILNEINLPIKKNDLIGKLIVNNNNKNTELNLYSTNDLDSIFSFKFINYFFSSTLGKIIKYILITFFFLLFLLIALRFHVYNKRRKRIKRKSYKKLY